jgi:hypothetical protein
VEHVGNRGEDWGGREKPAMGIGDWGDGIGKSLDCSMVIRTALTAAAGEEERIHMMGQNHPRPAKTGTTGD